MDFLEMICKFLNSNFLIGLATLSSAGAVVFVYYRELGKKKRDAAKMIIQEIRRAEDCIKGYNQHGFYQFTQKIVPTNNWALNMHYFVQDLTQDEIDVISNLYSMGEYLDLIISKISDLKFDGLIAAERQRIADVIAKQSHNQASGDAQVMVENKGIIIQNPLWNTWLSEISNKYEPIYHTTVCSKLKKIAGEK